jgi:hypothetical protein
MGSQRSTVPTRDEIQLHPRCSAMTPTISNGLPFTASVRPMTSAVPPSFVLQKCSLTTATFADPVSASASVSSRPSRALAPIALKN